MARSVMSRYEPSQMMWHYEHGLVLQSILILGEKIGSAEMCHWVKIMYDTKIKEDGSIDTYRRDEYNLDQINPGKTLFLLHKKYGEEKYRTAIEALMEQLRHHPRTKTGGFWHKNIYPWQMWLDGVYMADVFHARYAAEYGDTVDFDDVVHQFVLMESRARDRETGLLYHAWDEARKQLWANPETGCSPHFWGRAMGWYCMALADVLDIISPEYQKHRESLEAIARRLVAPILKFQDKKSGLWYQILDRPANGQNYTESSASCMFIYFLLKLIRMGVVSKIDKKLIEDAALLAYQGILREKIHEDESGELHLIDTCSVAGLGGNPYRDGSYEYYLSEPKRTNDFKGLGSFILASMEVESI